MSFWNELKHVGSSIGDFAASAEQHAVHAAESVGDSAKEVAQKAEHALVHEAHAAMNVGHTVIKHVEQGTKELGSDLVKAGKWTGHQAELLGEGAVTGAVLNPVNGVGQIVNHVSGAKLPKLEFSNQKEVDGSWAGKIGEVGGAVGVAIATDGAVGAAAGLETTSAAALGITGIVQGGILTPSRAGRSEGQFVLDRLKGAAINGASFSVAGPVSGKVASFVGVESMESAIGRLAAKGVSSTVGNEASRVVRTEASDLLNHARPAYPSEILRNVLFQHSH